MVRAEGMGHDGAPTSRSTPLLGRRQTGIPLACWYYDLNNNGKADIGEYHNFNFGGSWVPRRPEPRPHV